MIDELGTYELVHFLPFTQEVYDRMFVLHNETWWPAHLLTAIAAIAVVAAAWRARGDLVALVLAAAWLFVGVAFFGFRYAELLWAAPWIGAAFGLQTLLLLTAARTRFEVERPGIAAFAAAIVVVGWPLLTPLFAGPWNGAELFALTPTPTALATIAALCGTTRRSWFLWPIPVLWCAIASATAYALSSS